jgi:hypothetical protein
MKKTHLGIFALILGLSACNTNSESTAETESKSEEQNAAETSTEKKNELPAIPSDAKVFFANLDDGDTVSSPFLVEFGISGMEVEPAGAVNEGKGHHHIIINGGPIEMGGTVPADSVNIHYGKGQTSDSLDLMPGNYSLTMQFADGYHRSYGEQMSASIEVVVK